MPDWLRVTCEQVGINYDGHKKRLQSLPYKRQLSFISWHYVIIIGFALVGSVIIYGGGQIPYIDALFFASGAATQSGLNTIDVNTLQLYQQIAMYVVPMFCTPIFINTAVVVFRLYWFEKRFQHVVKEAMADRQSRSRSFARSFSRNSVDAERGNAAGVRGRPITVLRNSIQPIDQIEGFRDKAVMETVPESTSSSSSNSEKAGKEKRLEEEDGQALHSPRTIKFPDEADENADRHVAFVQRQRNETSTKPLRIPGPREADEGAVPEEVEARQDTNQDDEDDRPHGILKIRTESQSHSIRPNVTIEEPPRPFHPATSEGRGFHRRAPSNPYALRTPTSPIEEAGSPATKKRRNSSSSLRPYNSTDAAQGTVAYLSWQPTVGRNSLFVDLTEEQREELGGIEYRSLKTLLGVLVGYYLFFHVFGIIILVPWILRSAEWGQIVDGVGQNRVWWGFFSSATFFNDVGFTLTPDSFISFNTSWLVMLLGSFLIVIGNTGFPCMLRLIIWTISKLIPQDWPLYEELRFLLDHPRRCFTLLFPAAATWVLFGILVMLNGIDLIFFIILDLNDPVVTDLPPAYRFLDGVFQAVSTRTAGTACVNIANLHPGIKMSYLIMMYISVFPVAISIRRTNVYEERSLGIFSAAEQTDGDAKEPSYVSDHIGNQLKFDLWFLFIGWFIVAIAEGTRLDLVDQPNFDLFAVFFEIVSAYGTVGLSLGYPGINASFSAEFGVVSKLVIIAMQIRGRHRGLPYELDRAVLLPSEALHRKEEEESTRRSLMRRTSTVNLDDTGESIFRTATYRTNRESTAEASGIEAPTVSATQSGAAENGGQRSRARRGFGQVLAVAATGVDTGKRAFANFTRLGPRHAT